MAKTPKHTLKLHEAYSDCRVLDIQSGQMSLGRITRIEGRQLRLYVNRRFFSGLWIRLTFYDPVETQIIRINARISGGTLTSELFGPLIRKRIAHQARIPGNRIYEYWCRMGVWTAEPRSLEKSYERTPVEEPVEDLVGAAKGVSPLQRFVGPRLRFKIATGALEKLAAWKLVHREHKRRGMALPNRHDIAATPHLLLPGTVTYSGVWRDETIMTLTAVTDSPLKLPSDSSFDLELDSLRGPERRLVEFTMAVSRRGFFGTKPFSFKTYRRMSACFALFRIALQHAIHVLGATHIVITVSPGHDIALRFLGFEEIGRAESHPAFNGKPAICLQLDMQKATDPDFVKGPGRTVMMRCFLQRRVPDETLSAPWRLSMRDLNELFIKRSDLAQKLTDHQRQVLSLMSPELADWFENLGTILQYS